MSTHAHETRTSLLNDRIGILDRKAAGSPTANEVFRTVSAILDLLRDKTIANKDTVQLSDDCFNACEALETAIKERNADDLDESTRVALEDLGRVTLEIYWTLKGGTSTPQIKYKKGMIEGYKTEIQDILDDLYRPSLPCNGDKPVRSGITQQLHIHSVGGATSVSELGAFERLIRRKFISHELPSLIEEILMCKNVIDMIRYLPRDDAQTFIDVMNEALDMPDLSPWAQNQCLRPLYRTCGRHALLPKAMEIPVCYDPTGNALYKGGYADVWKGQYRGKDVAVKVIRIFSNSDLGKVIGRFCKEAITWKTLRHPNVLPLIGVTMTMNQFAMISGWMPNGNLNEFVEANPKADRLQLLGDAARGLIYIHERGVVHGDLKGANILVDQSCRAHLADFGLLTIISDPANLLSSSSYAQGGTARWMSPERISPQDFGLKTSRPSKSSDCYSLGMVIYEIVSGNPPFREDRDFTVCLNVLKGKRPLREDGFADRLWNTLEQCWMPQPSDRPSVEDVLECLETCSDKVAEGMEGNVGLDGLITKLHEYHRPPFPLHTVRNVLSPSDTANLHAGTPLVTTIRCTTSSPHQRAFSLANRVMSQTTPSADNLGESIALSRHEEAGINLSFFDKYFVPSIYRGHDPLPSIPSPQSLPVSFGTGRSSPVSMPAHGSSLFGLLPSGIEELGQKLDAGSNLAADMDPHLGSSQTHAFLVSNPNIKATAAAEANRSRRKMPANYFCTVPSCGGTFTLKFALKAHMRSHRGEKPFECQSPGCGERFGRLGILRTHEQIHSNNRSHKCEVCGKIYKSMDSLKRHLRSGGGSKCRKAMEEAQAANTANFAGLSFGNSMGSGPSDSAASSVAMDFDDLNSTGGSVHDSVEAGPDNYMSGVSMVLDA